MKHLLTVTGADRPGLIARVTRVIAEAGADLEDVSMTRLSGNFAMILLARGGDEAAMRKGLEAVAQELSLFAHLEPAAENEDQEASHYLSIAGPNRAGIVAGLAEALARHGVNILEMSSKLLQRTEVPVYFIRMEIKLAAGAEALEADLQAVAKELGVQLQIEPIERADL